MHKQSHRGKKKTWGRSDCSFTQAGAEQCLQMCESLGIHKQLRVEGQYMGRGEQGTGLGDWSQANLDFTPREEPKNIKLKGHHQIHIWVPLFWLYNG
jgi:hypothetical protein